MWESDAWFALHTRRNHEAVVTRCLEARGVEAYLPFREVRRRWAHRMQRLYVPLFPGYSFARFCAAQWTEVIDVRGVIQVVGTIRGPSAIPDEQIEAVRKLENGQFRCDPYPYLAVGKSVCVAQGPLRGLVGQLIRKGRSHRFVVCLPVLGQSVGVEIDAAILELV